MSASCPARGLGGREGGLLAGGTGLQEGVGEARGSVLLHVVLDIELRGHDYITVDGHGVADDDIVLRLAHEARTTSIDPVCAVLHTDSAVSHGRVLRVIGLLKQAGIDRIAFEVDGVIMDAWLDARP